MDAINPIGSVVARMRQLENSSPSQSIADVAGNPNVSSSDAPSADAFTAKYEMAALARVMHANADQALSLIQMLDTPASPLK
jgi:hypothetical protein